MLTGSGAWDDCDKGATTGGYYGTADMEDGEIEELLAEDEEEMLRGDSGTARVETLQISPNATEQEQGQQDKAAKNINATSTPIQGGFFSSWMNRTM